MTDTANYVPQFYDLNLLLEAEIDCAAGWPKARAASLFAATAALVRAAQEQGLAVIPAPAPWHPATVLIRPYTETEKWLTNGKR